MQDGLAPATLSTAPLHVFIRGPPSVGHKCFLCMCMCVCRRVERTAALVGLCAVCYVSGPEESH